VSKIKIFLIRHGITDWNIQGILQGREDIHLNIKGIEQAHNCGKNLAGIHFKYILSSPLCRAAATAGIIGEYVQNKNIIIEEDLTERDYGVLSGKHPKGLDIFNPGEDTEGLEPLDKTARRFSDIIKKYCDNSEDNIIVVSHGGVINAFLRDITDGEVGSGKTRLLNAGVNIVGYKNGTFSLLVHNIPADDIKKYI